VFSDQSGRTNSQQRAGILPCLASQALMKSGVSRKSASAADSFEQSITTAGAIRSPTGIVSVEELGRSRPDTQWIGASKCVPVCSPNDRLFQYQAPPRSSQCEHAPSV